MATEWMSLLRILLNAALRTIFGLDLDILIIYLKQARPAWFLLPNMIAGLFADYNEWLTGIDSFDT